MTVEKLSTAHLLDSDFSYFSDSKSNQVLQKDLINFIIQAGFNLEVFGAYLRYLEINFDSKPNLPFVHSFHLKLAKIITTTHHFEPTIVFATQFTLNQKDQRQSTTIVVGACCTDLRLLYLCLHTVLTVNSDSTSSLSLNIRTLYVPWYLTKAHNSILTNISSGSNLPARWVNYLTKFFTPLHHIATTSGWSCRCRCPWKLDSNLWGVKFLYFCRQSFCWLSRETCLSYFHYDFHCCYNYSKFVLFCRMSDYYRR